MLIFGDLDDPNSPIFDILSTKPFITNKPHLGTKPKLFVIPNNKGGIEL